MIIKAWNTTHLEYNALEKQYFWNMMHLGDDAARVVILEFVGAILALSIKIPSFEGEGNTALLRISD